MDTVELQQVEESNLTQDDGNYIKLTEKDVQFTIELLFLDDKRKLQKRTALGKPVTKKGKPVMVKVKTLVKAEIARMPVVNYKAFIRILFEKAVEYVSTLHWMHNAVSKARVSEKTIQLSVKDENVTFGASEMAHLKNDLIFVLNNIKSYVRSTKRASRTSATPESFESVYSTVYLLSDFNDIVKGFTNHLRDAADDARDFYESTSEEGPGFEHSEDLKLFDNWVGFANSLYRDDSVIKTGMAQKFSVMSIFYSMAYLQNALEARKIQVLDMPADDLKGLSKGELTKLKSAYTGGSFTTPAYLRDILDRVSYWNFHSHVKTTKAGKTSYTFTTFKNVSSDSYNQVMAQASRANLNLRVAYNSNKLEMKFVNRLISLLTIDVETYILLYFDEPDNDADKLIRNEINNINGETIGETINQRKEYLIRQYSYDSKLASDSIAPSGRFVNSSSVNARGDILDLAYNSNMLSDTAVITKILHQTSCYHEHSRARAEDAKSKINKAIASIARKARK
jgi:hypothetical protein